ncbi:hypothetical protein [Rugosimonospora africana]|uniref:Uncharacterized protein n=1 Tax=Rugosimonospora africana TaxID=556532 RepID=A0A8J3VSH7_9ACTN|nr:hypothetical protein [Rugosimonospora africana]GIH17079.1 hypothetical protein Raf01_52510 [Rugosimonospora africana]
MTDDELDEIERRAMLATPGPWEARLETRWGTGGASCIDLNPGGDEDAELYFIYDPIPRVSPNADLDADLDFVAHARTDVPHLVAEIRRLRSLVE